MKDYSSGIQDHSSGIQDHSTGIQDHSSGIQDHSSGIQDHSSGIQDHSSGMQDHTSGMAWRWKCRLLFCSNRKTVSTYQNLKHLAYIGATYVDDLNFHVSTLERSWVDYLKGALYKTAVITICTDVR